MGEGALRGARIGAHSVQGDSRAVELEPRSEHVYRCENEHDTRVVFAAEAEVPHQWTCKVCGAEAVLFDTGKPDAGTANDDVRTPRSHWDMLLERRTRDQLQDILDERLEYLHERRRLAREEQLKRA